MTDKEKMEKADYTDFAGRAETGVRNGKGRLKTRCFRRPANSFFIRPAIKPTAAALSSALPLRPKAA